MLFCSAITAQVTIDSAHFSDVNFRAIVTQQDTNSNRILSTEEIYAVNVLGVSSATSLIGVQHIVALTYLSCSFGSLDLSKNTALTDLYCGHGLLAG